MEVEGLYRVSGSKVDVERLQRLLEVGTATTDALEAQDKHVIAGAIKKVRNVMGGGSFWVFDSCFKKSAAAHASFFLLPHPSIRPPTHQQVLQEHEPLLPYGMFDAFLAVPRSDANGQATNAEERARAYQGLLAVLPPVSRALLGHLLLHLKRVGD